MPDRRSVQIERDDDLAIAPKYFGRDLPNTILSELRRKVEGSCSGTYGYTILVTHLKSYGRGVLNVDTGWAHFPVKYLSLAFRPFRNEVLPAEVFAVNQVRLLSYCLCFATD